MIIAPKGYWQYTPLARLKYNQTLILGCRISPLGGAGDGLSELFLSFISRAQEILISL